MADGAPTLFDERFEYYWEDGRVVEYTNHRNGNRGRWPLAPHDRRNLIVAIKRDHQTTQITNGEQATPDRLAESLLRFSRYDCDPNAPEIGSQIPPDLLRQVVEHAKQATDKATRQWEATGNEEGQTGYFAGTMNDVDKFQHGEWEASIRVQVFSPQTKEPKVGADMGIIVDLRRGKEHVVKGTLVQAKRARGIPNEPMDLPDLTDQVATMQQTTDESYGMIYSDQDTYVFDPKQPHDRIAVESFFKDEFICRRGDRNPTAVAQAYDRSIVIDVTVATGVIT